MTVATLTKEERDQMAHAIGHHSSTSCSRSGGRNHYVTASDDALWCGLVERGLARRRSSTILEQGEAVFHVTDEGRQALETDPRSARKGRQYAVALRGYEDNPTYVWAPTRGKAKSKVARDYADAYPDGNAFMEIVFCRVVRHV